MIKDIYELLTHIQARPVMWLGKAEISALKNFLDGFVYARWIYVPQAHEWPPFNLLQIWTELRFNRWPCAESWAGLLLAHCQGDEEAALLRFFELLDEFKQMQVVRGLEISLGDDNRAFYYSPDCQTRRYTAVPTTEANRLPAPDQIYLLQFSGLGFYTFLHRGGKFMQDGDYHRSLRAALKQLRQEFGPVLHQKPVADLSPAAMAAIIQPTFPDAV